MAVGGNKEAAGACSGVHKVTGCLAGETSEVGAGGATCKSGPTSVTYPSVYIETCLTSKTVRRITGTTLQINIPTGHTRPIPQQIKRRITLQTIRNITRVTVRVHNITPVTPAIDRRVAWGRALVAVCFITELAVRVVLGVAALALA